MTFYQCPLCFQPLQLHNHVWRCSNRHSYDQAKEGYVNLLPVQHKHSKMPGDNQQMIIARRSFLDTAFYQPLREMVVNTLIKQLTPQAKMLLDIGCGEGYYTSAIAQALTSLQVYGIDIAKVAIKYAAARYKHVNFSVASSYRLPFVDDSIDAVVRIYAPCKAAELSRVLKNDGIVVAVTPAAGHLYQFKQLIYPSVHEHTVDLGLSGFTIVDQQRLTYDMTLSSQHAVNLLQMTPFAWKASDNVWQLLADCRQFVCQADFNLVIYRKN